MLEEFYRSPDRAARAHASFQKAVQGISERFCSALGSAPEADVVFYLGLCSGAGWATALGGRPVVLLGIEKIVELGWEREADMAVLLCHELGHLWHFEMRTAPAWGETPAARALRRLAGMVRGKPRAAFRGISAARGRRRKHAGLFRGLVRI